MPLTKFYWYKRGGYIYFIQNNEVFFASFSGRVAKSAISLESFKKQYTEPSIEAETPEEALDFYRILRE